jgi:hypothetical protein
MPGLGQPRPHRAEIEEGQLRLAGDLSRGRLGNDAELGLGLGEGGFHVEPGLEARRFREERPPPGVIDAERGGLVLHGRYLARPSRDVNTPPPRSRMIAAAG